MDFTRQSTVSLKPVRLKAPDFKLCYTNEYLTTEVNKLKLNVENICNNRSTNLSYEELYRLVENLSSLNKCENMKEDLHFVIWNYLNIQKMQLFQNTEGDFLSGLLKIWQEFCSNGKLLRNIYLFLEVASTRLYNLKYSVWNLCLEIYRNTIMSNEDEVKEKLMYMFTLIEINSNSQHDNDVQLVQDIASMLDCVGLYESYFEEPFLQHTEDFYKREREVLQNGDIIQYFYYVQTQIQEKIIRILNFFKPCTKRKIYNLMFKTLIEDNVNELLSKLEGVNLFDTKDINSIVTVYTYLGKLKEGNVELCKIFKTYMITKGRAIVYDTKSEHNLVSELLKFKDRIDEIVNVCFNNNDMYMEAVRISFKKFINQRKYKPAQFLAKFIDIKMRERQIPEDLLDKVIVLFRYIQGKDVFEAYYKRYLAKRLLLGKSSSQDAEKYMLSKLKVECGEEFTNKLEGMLRDVDMSEELIQAFKNRPCDGETSELEFTAYILTNSFWPTFCKYKAILSDTMTNYQMTFNDFYKTTYSGRSLDWIGSLDTCLIKAKFPKGKKELQVSLFQALILLLFNENSVVSLKTIRENLGIDDSELRRTVSSLITSHSNILKITNPQPAPAADAKNKLLNMTDDDEFVVNENFSHKLFRIKINQLQYKDTDEEQKITESEVMHDRHLQIDAALVRIMKQHQRMKHNELVAEVFRVLKFPLTQSDVKKRIEILIGRDFLARHPDEANVFLYVA